MIIDFNQPSSTINPLNLPVWTYPVPPPQIIAPATTPSVIETISLTGKSSTGVSLTGNIDDQE